MLEVNYLRKNKEIAIQSLTKRNFDAVSIINEIISLDDERKKNQKKIDDLLSNSNQINKEIGQFYKKGEVENAEDLKIKSINIKSEVNKLLDSQKSIEHTLTDLLLQVPNIPNKIVNKGQSEKDNVIIIEKGSVPDLPEDKKPHWELAKEYNLIDFELGNKITGSGFPVYIDLGAKLQRSLISYFLDKNIMSGYKEYLPPHLVNSDSGYGTGQLPKFEEDLYKVEMENNPLYLIPTAEVPITNLFRNTIIKDNLLPIKCTAYTPCFRREAGSYGKEVRGLNRLHQFDKVEIVEIHRQEDSAKALDNMVSHVASIIEELSLPYRIMKLCGGDLGFSSSLTYDFEVFSAGQERWLEVSSVSNFQDFQANRMKLRYKNIEGINKLCHTLNGSSLALPRIFAALLENNQKKDRIEIPKILRPYMGLDYITK
ncbi:MAG: serine--tRNA ligase [Flavobacteriales bacterium]|nr:serine--tRNA ligase [Flavobacteriales bacterium]